MFSKDEPRVVNIDTTAPSVEKYMQQHVMQSKCPLNVFITLRLHTGKIYVTFQ